MDIQLTADQTQAYGIIFAFFKEKRPSLIDMKIVITGRPTVLLFLSNRYATNYFQEYLERVTKCLLKQWHRFTKDSKFEYPVIDEKDYKDIKTKYKNEKQRKQYNKRKRSI